MGSNMQPVLAPAPHRLGPPAESAAEQSLAQHLGAHLHGNPSNVGIDMSHSHVRTPHSQNIDPAIAGTGAPSASAGDGGQEDANVDAKKGGKRELSTSKRAAQNRAAQRNFRQRKEGHIKVLESQVKDYNSLLQRFGQVQTENYQLRDYIIRLQSRLLEAQADFPQPPPNIDLHRRNSESQHQPAMVPTAPMGSSISTEMHGPNPQAATVDDTSISSNAGEFVNPVPSYKGPGLHDKSRSKPSVNHGEQGAV